MGDGGPARAGRRLRSTFHWQSSDNVITSTEWTRKNRWHDRGLRLCTLTPKHPRHLHQRAVGGTSRLARNGTSRRLIENFFCKLKEFKRIAMRADKTDQGFAANICLATAGIQPWISTGLSTACTAPLPRLPAPPNARTPHVIADS